MKREQLTPATLKELQTELLYLLKIVDKVCRENNIEYWLEAGTLLGAVRHKGFIPWDDDIDISVPAESYLKLISALDAESKVNKDIFLYYEHNKVPKIGIEKLATTKLIMEMKGVMNACFIDIFPARMINKNNTEEDLNIISTNQYFDSGSAAKIGVNIDKKYIKSNFSDAFLEKEKFTRYFHFEYLPSCNYKGVGSIVKRSSMEYYLGAESYFSYSDVFPLRKITFEGFEFSCPNNSENYLTTWFGDYMALPPKSQQVAKHSDQLFFCNSAQFTKESTTNYLVEQSKKFYYFSIRRLVKDWTIRLGIFDKFKMFDMIMKKLKNFITKHIKLSK